VQHLSFMVRKARPWPMRCARWRGRDPVLVLSRRADESILIQPADGVDVTMTMAQLFANGPIQITLLGGTGRRIKMGIDAPEQLAIRRKDSA
jgi:sRNA-binding carbon storage regulator CsrA